MYRLFLCAVLPLLARGQSGFDECPCITITNLPTTSENGSTCLNPTCDSPLRDHDLGCVNATYGSSTCAKHDATMPACLVGSPPSHCAQPWSDNWFKTAAALGDHSERLSGRLP